MSDIGIKQIMALQESGLLDLNRARKGLPSWLHGGRETLIEQYEHALSEVLEVKRAIDNGETSDIYSEVMDAIISLCGILALTGARYSAFSPEQYVMKNLARGVEAALGGKQ